MSDKKSWRPEGFNTEAIARSLQVNEWIEDREVALVNAGADAMLEELRKQGTRAIRYPISETEKVNGYMVFIPD